MAGSYMGQCENSVCADSIGVIWDPCYRPTRQYMFIGIDICTYIDTYTHR